MIDVEQDIIGDPKTRQLSWYGNVRRLGQDWLPEKVLDWIPQRRHRRNWREGIEGEIWKKEVWKKTHGEIQRSGE